MNCREAERLLEPFFDGELDGRLMREAALHITRCQSCERDLQQKERLHDLLSEVIVGEAESSDLASLWSGIQAGIAGDAVPAGAIATEVGPLRMRLGRRRGGRSVERASRASRGRSVARRVSAAAGLGAVALVGLGVFLLFPGEQDLEGHEPLAERPELNAQREPTRLADESRAAPEAAAARGASPMVAQRSSQARSGVEAVALGPVRDSERLWSDWPQQVSAGPLDYNDHFMSLWRETTAR